MRVWLSSLPGLSGGAPLLGIILQTLPFFACIGPGYGAGRTGFFSGEETAYFAKFVFYFAQSAMPFRVAANLSLSEVLDRSPATCSSSRSIIGLRHSEIRPPS